MSKFKSLLTEDWLIVLSGFSILLLAILFPTYIPTLPKTLSSGADFLQAGEVYLLLLGITLGVFKLLGRPLKNIWLSLLTIFGITLLAQATARVPFFKELGLESVFFAVIYGLLISNTVKVPEWLKPAIQSEFYIKIGIICLGATILIGSIVESGIYALVQALLVVFVVWYFAFWISKKYFKVDEEMSTMLSSSVSICGVSAAIATAGVIEGDRKKLSYVISLVLVVAVPMMYFMPWLASKVLPLIIEDPNVVAEVAGAWMGGTIDTTGAVVASGALISEHAKDTAVIVKSSQNVLLGIAAFLISIYWTYRSQHEENSERKVQKPTLGLIWERFPKFVVGFVLASLIFSVFFDGPKGTDDAAIRSIAKTYSNTLFSVAFVAIGLETRFADVFSKNNRKALGGFLTAQTFNIVWTLIITTLLFGFAKPYFSN